MSSSFALALEEARGEVSLSKLAKAMAGPSSKDGRGPAGNLSRLQNGKQKPSQDKIEQIVEALASLTSLTSSEQKYWRSRLMSAAGYGAMKTAARLHDSESEVRRSLHPDCRKALQNGSQLKDYEIDAILDHIAVSTMKLIIAAAEEGEEIEVVLLEKISAELQQTAAHYSGAIVDTSENMKGADTEINAGRAKILIYGDVSPAQMQVLKNAAEMIESVLKL